MIDPQGAKSYAYFDKKICTEMGGARPLFVKAPDLLSLIMTKLVKANSLVNEFGVDGKFILTAATLEIIDGVRRKMT